MAVRSFNDIVYGLLSTLLNGFLLIQGSWEEATEYRIAAWPQFVGLERNMDTFVENF